MTATAATRILTEEHRLIERGLDCLAVVARDARQNGRLESEPATEALALVREFADHCHHAKEEDRLFVAMESQGMPRQGGPIGVMLDEHEQGRAHLRAMAESLERAAAADAGAIDAFARHAADLDELLREHIQKEDTVLFPMADELLDRATGEALLRDFHNIESDAGGARHREWVARLGDLCERCRLERPDPSRLPTLQKEFL